MYKLEFYALKSVSCDDDLINKTDNAIVIQADQVSSRENRPPLD